MTVFANMMEVSAKAQGCKIVAAFPDVCFTPPQTPATPPGVPIPYPNFGMDSDLASGSSTVKIGGKPISQENASNYSKCSGDEAGAAPKKGIVSSKNMGKVYGQMWSMDVKVDAKGVLRFGDIATSNHSANPGDTPPMALVGTLNPPPDASDPCEKDNAAEKEACGDKTKEEACAEAGLDKPVGQLQGSSGGSDTLFTADYAAGGTAIGGISGAPEGSFRDRAIWIQKWDESQACGCLRARRCKLEPYNNGDCCCPGQTGHHLVDAACFNKVGRDLATGGAQIACLSTDNPYDPNKAPCICAEGPSATKGSHGALHTEMKNHVMLAPQANIAYNDGTTQTSRSMTYGEFRDKAIDGVMRVFPMSNCSPACLKAQLDAYHKDQLKVPEDAPLRCEPTGREENQRAVATAYNRAREAAKRAAAPGAAGS